MTALCTVADADTIISHLGPQGRRAAGRIGQTLLVPRTDTVLTSFTLQAEAVPVNTNPVSIIAHVARWDDAGMMPTGPFLYSSSPTPVIFTGIKTLTFDVGEIEFLPGERIALLGFRASGSVIEWGSKAGFPDGFAAIQIDNDPVPWAVGGDFAFEARFTTPSPVPEPQVWMLFAVGAVILASSEFRRRRETKA